MEGDRKFFAFISYKREDEKWAKWLKHMLEYYHMPSTLNGQSHPKNLRYVYRDVEGLASGDLSPQIHDALEKSKNLIVICSPRVVANPTWVNKEIEYFAALKDENGEKKKQRIFPFIIEGIPHAKNPEEECFPSALLAMTKDEDKLGGNVNEGGRELAAVKLIAGMLGVGLMDLWNPFERERRQKRWLVRGIGLLILLFLSGITWWIWHQNVLLKEREWQMLENQSRAVSERALDLIDEGDSYLARLLAVEILPKDLQHPNRPYTVEAEAVLRKAWARGDAIFRGHTTNATAVAFSPDDKYIVSGSTDNSIRVWDVQTGLCIDTLLGHTGMVNYVSYSPDGTKIFSSARDSTARIWDVSSSLCLRTLNNVIRPVRSVLFMDSGQKAVFSREGMVVTSWNLTNGKSYDYTLQPYGFFRYAPLYCEKDSVIAVSGSSPIKMMNLESKALLQSFECDFDIKACA